MVEDYIQINSSKNELIYIIENGHPVVMPKHKDLFAKAPFNQS